MRSRLLLGILAGTICVGETRADENLFGDTYMADVLHKGKWELEQWVTSRIGKETGTFVANDLRTEIEYGFTDHLQGSLYLTIINSTFTTPRPAANRSTTRIISASMGSPLSGNIRCSPPYKDNFGLTFYLEPGYGTIESATGERHQEVELEGKFILEKHWLEDALIGAFNYTIEPEWKKAMEIAASTLT